MLPIDSPGAMYDPTAVQPMRDDLIRVGFRELRDSREVDATLRAPEGTTLLVINSVCGCAAGGARPGAMLALQHERIPDRLVTVFAGQDREATSRARELLGQPPSSPAIALLRDGELIGMLHRQDIEGRHPVEIARALTVAFDRHCTRPGPSIPSEEFEKIAPHQACGSSIPRGEEPPR